MKCANCNEAHPAWSKTCVAFITASKTSPKPTAAKIVSSSSVSRGDLETLINSAIGALWESLARVISTVVSKATLDLEAELKKGKGKVEDRGGLVLKATSHSVKAIKECGLLHPNRTLEVTEVQKSVWKDIFPLVEFPHSSQASSTPHSSSVSN